MNFLQPAFLWALPLAGIPILIHLLNRRRFQKVEFSAMEFLFRARKKMRRKLILEDWFLLFLRTASVALFILALAQPGSEDPLNESTRPAQGTVVLLDASMSMSHRDQGLSSFDRAQRSALQALSSLESKLGDRAALVLAGGKPRRVVSGSPHEVQLALQELTEPSHEADQWALALKAAHQAGQDLLREGCQTVSIQLFSDFQASGWHLTEVDGESLRTLRDDGFTIIPVNTGSAQRNNWAVTKLQCSPMNVQPDEFCEVFVEVSAFGDAPPRSISGRLEFDGQPIAQHTFDLSGRDQATWQHTLIPASMGSRGLQFILEGDACQADDQRSAVLTVSPPPRILAFGDPELCDRLALFFDFGPGSLLDWNTAQELRSTSLEDLDVVIVADPPTLGEQQRAYLVQFVERGGSLLLCPAEHMRAADFAALLQDLALSGIQLGDVREILDPSARLAISQPDWPALQLFKEPQWRPLLTELPILRYREILLPANTPTESIPLGLVQEHPERGTLLLNPGAFHHKFESGASVVLFPHPPKPGWNRFSDVLGATMPFWFDLLLDLSARQSQHQEVVAGAPLVASFTEPILQLRLSAPDGRKYRPTVHASGETNLEEIIHARTLQLGLWTLETDTLGTQGLSTTKVTQYAVNPAPEESPLTAIPDPLLAEHFPTANSLSHEGTSHRVETSEPWSARLFLLIMGLLLLETLIAGRLDRKRG